VIPELRSRAETYPASAGPLDLPVLVWRLPRPYRSISSGPLGGGLGTAKWIINCTVPMSYHRDDPGAHLREIAAGLGLTGPGVGLLTGVDVAERVVGEDCGVTCWATVGLGAPAWAAAPDGDLRRIPPGHRDEPSHQPPRPGTVNCVIVVPAHLSDAALVNAVATATEAKAQALWELGVEATGTASDAACVLCLPEGPVEEYAGPRSRWGARLARAVRTAVHAGGRDWLVSGLAWSDARRRG
jgi:adenosylcobinamide amidohydrolase